MAETTGLKTVTTLRKYINGRATSDIKPNQVSDPDYIAPYNDTRSCPLYTYEVNPPVPTAPSPTATIFKAIFAFDMSSLAPSSDILFS